MQNMSAGCHCNYIIYPNQTGVLFYQAQQFRELCIILNRLIFTMYKKYRK
jgi:hypothetical protein